MRPSHQVLAALAGALRLSAAERAHLYQLAGISPPADDSTLAESVAPAVADMVARLDPFPAYVKGRRLDVLAANRRPSAIRRLGREPARGPQHALVGVHRPRRAQSLR